MMHRLDAPDDLGLSTQIDLIMEEVFRYFYNT